VEGGDSCKRAQRALGIATVYAEVDSFSVWEKVLGSVPCGHKSLSY
jgi:hypothetical protein